MSQPAVHSWSKGLTDVLYSTGQLIREESEGAEKTQRSNCKSGLNIKRPKYCHMDRFTGRQCCIFRTVRGDKAAQS